MAYIVNIVPEQVSGVAFDEITSGTLTIENPDDTTGLLPLTVPITEAGGTYYFSVDETFNATSNYKFTVDLEFTLRDGTECVRQFVYFDEILPEAAFTNGFTNGFFS